MIRKVSYATFDAPTFMFGEDIETLQDVRSYKYDYLEGKIIVTGTGKTLEDTAIDAYRYWAIKCCLTERYERDCYSSDFGIEFNAIVRANYPRGIAESELKRTIKEALMIDERTVNVSSFSFEWKDDSCWVHFLLESIYGIDRIELQRGGELNARVSAT